MWVTENFHAHVCSLKNHILAYLLNGELHCSNSLIGNGHQDLFEVVDLHFRHSNGDTVPLDEAKERRHIVVSYQYRDAAKPQRIHDPRTPCFVATGTQTKFGCLESSETCMKCSNEKIAVDSTHEGGSFYTVTHMHTHIFHTLHSVTQHICTLHKYNMHTCTMVVTF